MRPSKHHSKHRRPGADESAIVPGSGKPGSNLNSFTNLSGEIGMSVPSSQRGGSGKFGANDKGAGKGESEKPKS